MMVAFQHYGYFPLPLTKLIYTRIFIHAEEAPCTTDSKFENQDLPGQVCEQRPEYGSHMIYAFPVSYYSSFEQNSTYRRQYSDVNNFGNYGLAADQVWSAALMAMMTPFGDWNKATFPIQRNAQYSAPASVYAYVSFKINFLGFLEEFP
jgi:hypothetical protein